jgi:transcriptional regulator with XRE-family HTH domain|tara:strand:+ start:3239 stop:3580 length:342 start_codon:yes stop_codon:yes gene_type:complete
VEEMQLLLGPLAKAMRLQLGLKQGELAKEIGTSSGNLCRFEKGSQGLSDSLLLKLTKKLNTTPEHLILMNMTTTPSELLEYAILLSKLNAKQMTGVMAVIDALSIEDESTLKM